MSFNVYPIDGRYHNVLLSKLCAKSAELIDPHLQRVTLVKSQVLYEDDTPMDSIYFIESGLATLMVDTGDNVRVQVGMVGREGFVGTVSMFDGDLRALHRTVVQIAGTALRISQPRFQKAIEELPDLKPICMRHSKASTLQISQLAGCNVRHSIPQRLSRVILMVQDRVGGTRVVLTQEDLAAMLGVRRAGISVAIGDLEGLEVLRQARGFIEITDRAKLERCACRCHDMIIDRQCRIMDVPLPPRLELS